MASNNYLQNDKTARLPLFYGIHNLHDGNGKLIRQKIETVGSSQIMTVQLALGVAPLHNIVKATYDLFDISLENVILHNDGDDPTDAYFPSDVEHPGASWANIKLPEGFSVDGNTGKIVLQVEGREIADYNSEGSQTGFGYSKSPARILADANKLLTGSISNLEMVALDEFKAWCAETISVIKDGVTISIPRFELSLFFIPPFSLKAILDKITELTCSDWQERKGKIRLIPAVNRLSEYTFDLSKVTRDFTFVPTPKTERPNGIIVPYRDINDPFLEDAEPEIVKRDELITADNGIENFYPINAGVCNKSQAERVANYWAKVRCDLTDFALNISGHPDSYKMIPADIATLSHTTPNWTNKRVKIIKKTEKEDRNSNGDGIEIFDAYRFHFQLEPSNPYSDTDHSPMVTREPIERVNPYAAPPVISALTLSESVRILDDGTVNISIVGIATFGDFGLSQKGKVYWKKVGGSYEELRDIFPDGDNQGQFRITNLTQGEYKVKIVTFNLQGFQRTSGVVEYSITCDGKDDAPNPVTSFTLQYLNGYYIGKFTKPSEADIKQFNVYDNSNNFLFATNSTYFTYQSDKASLTLKVDVEDTSRNKSTKVSASGSVSYAVIDKTGVATLDTVKIQIAGTPIGATHRKIEISTNSDMSSPETPQVHELADQTLITLDKVTRTYSDSPQTKYIEVFHSLDGGTTWTAASNRLTIQFYNELEYGVPLIDRNGELALIGNIMTFSIPRPYKNGNVSRTDNELMMTDDSNFGIFDGAHSDSVTTITCQAGFRDFDTSGWAASGKALLQRNTGEKEIINYTSRDESHLYGVTRGLEGTTPISFADGDGVWWVCYQKWLGGNLEPREPQYADSIYAYFRWRNEVGYSEFVFMGRIAGTVEGATSSTMPSSPPPVPPSLPPGYEDPYNPIYDKYQRERDIDIF